MHASSSAEGRGGGSAPVTLDSQSSLTLHCVNLSTIAAKKQLISGARGVSLGAGAARTSPRRRTRLAPAARRRQILDVARRVLTEQGVEKVQIKEVADLAGISRPVVYRFFPMRKDLVLSILEDFEAELSARFRDAFVRTAQGGVREITRAFIEASCDAIEVKGAGPWYLFDARKIADPEVARLGLLIHERLLAPWHASIAEATGLDAERVKTLLRVIVASGRAALDGWLDGCSSRPQAVHDATRSVAALLTEFAQPRKLASAGADETHRSRSRP